jgi:hypothetical protein
LKNIKDVSTDMDERRARAQAEVVRLGEDKGEQPAAAREKARDADADGAAAAGRRARAAPPATERADGGAGEGGAVDRGGGTGAPLEPLPAGGPGARVRAGLRALAVWYGAWKGAVEGAAGGAGGAGGAELRRAFAAIPEVLALLRAPHPHPSLPY